MTQPVPSQSHRIPNAPGFAFERDAFAFRNELVWEYRPDGAGGMASAKAVPPPTYAHHCFVMVRACRQFHLHARFEPGESCLPETLLRERVSTIVRRNPREPSREADRVILPGDPGLRVLSRRCEPVLKDLCGGAWQSYVLRSHWRMVFPFSRDHQARESGTLWGRLEQGHLPIVHVVRFPELTINHGLLLFGAEEMPGGIRFDAYDPNIPAAPAQLIYDRASSTFTLPANLYWAGGRVDVMEIYRSAWF
jgi:hypothetical protein